MVNVETVYFVTVQDAGRTAVVLGPFDDEAECREWAYTPNSGGTAKGLRLRRIADDIDPRSAFYAWGMTKVTGPEARFKGPEGSLNTRVLAYPLGGWQCTLRGHALAPVRDFSEAVG